MIKRSDTSKNSDSEPLPPFHSTATADRINKSIIEKIPRSQFISEIAALGRNWSSEFEAALGVPQENELSDGKILKIDRQDGWIFYINSKDLNADEPMRAVIGRMQLQHISEKIKCPKKYYAICVHSKLDVISMYLFDLTKGIFFEERMVCTHPKFTSGSKSLTAEDFQMDWGAVITQLKANGHLIYNSLNHILQD